MTGRLRQTWLLGITCLLLAGQACADPILTKYDFSIEYTQALGIFPRAVHTTFTAQYPLQSEQQILSNPRYLVNGKIQYNQTYRVLTLPPGSYAYNDVRGVFGGTSADYAQAGIQFLFHNLLLDGRLIIVRDNIGGVFDRYRVENWQAGDRFNVFAYRQFDTTTYYGQALLTTTTRQVPEPSSLSLILTGLLMIWLFRTRRVGSLQRP